MTAKQSDIDELSKKISKGLKKSLKHLVETKAAKNENLIVRDTKGKIKAIPAKEFLPLVINENTKMHKKQSKLEKMICQAIKERKMLWFYYESGSGNYWRKVEPYILAIKDKGQGNIFFTGYVHPSEERKGKSTNDNQGQYLMNKIDVNKFEVL
jgi:Neuraminidase (sialidase)